MIKQDFRVSFRWKISFIFWHLYFSSQQTEHVQRSLQIQICKYSGHPDPDSCPLPHHGFLRGGQSGVAYPARDRSPHPPAPRILRLQQRFASHWSSDDEPVISNHDLNFVNLSIINWNLIKLYRCFWHLDLIFGCHVRVYILCNKDTIFILQYIIIKAIKIDNFKLINIRLWIDFFPP